MSGEELKKKLDDGGYVQAEVARMLGIIPQSLNQMLNAQDVKSDLIEDLCRVLNLSIDYFYCGTDYAIDGDNTAEIVALKKENDKLKSELNRLRNLKDGKVYNLWMKFMEITSEMQELYKEEKK